MNERMGKPLVVAVVVLLGSFGWGPARAADDGAAARAARAKYGMGMKHYNVGRYREALKEFEAGYYLKPDPAFLFNLGQCHRQLGDHEDAARQYRAYLRAWPAAPNRADVEQFIREADAAIAKKGGKPGGDGRGGAEGKVAGDAKPGG